ncbi:hypothetical protein [Nocardioides mesophilus]|uniref:DUF485 domain-containing protein n=1 Tax=Nocardioides mesophilus TaxID=433659 RepID=A0A7G9RGD6_9ACTN|nr:hypothetical protein [Nocardioides mesophilus]QNN54661.1 hypothetical protein H9L09_10365 [Nocardioides mesophilus]
MTPADPPRRVRVTSPRTDAVRPRRSKATSEIDAQTQLGEVYMSSLLRAQGRLAALVLASLALTVGALPLLFRAVPALTDARLLGMPVTWVLLAFAVYPFLFALAWFYVRAAERNERDFADVVERE